MQISDPHCYRYYYYKYAVTLMLIIRRGSSLVTFKLWHLYYIKYVSNVTYGVILSFSEQRMLGQGCSDNIFSCAAWRLSPSAAHW